MPASQPQSPDDVVIHRARHGVFAHYASDEGIGQFLRLYGEWAEDEIVLLCRFIQPGGTVLDIGANIGTHAVAFAQMVGAGGVVIAIEGQPSVQKLLAYNVVCNGASEIVWPLNAIAGEAVGVTQCAITAHRGSKNYGLANFRDLSSIAASASGDIEIQLPIVTIDSLNLKKCDLIKIDVEGMEFPVLKGARKTLSSMAPVVYFEQTQGFNVDFPAIYDLLRSLNYKLYWHIANPFNRNNYKGATQNIFGGAVEVNVLACPDRMSAPADLAAIETPVYDPPIPPVAESLQGVSLRAATMDASLLGSPRFDAAIGNPETTKGGWLKYWISRLDPAAHD